MQHLVLIPLPNPAKTGSVVLWVQPFFFSFHLEDLRKQEVNFHSGLISNGN